MAGCPKCSLPIDCKRDVFTVCEGSCCQSFHAACVDLPEDSVAHIRTNNIIWLCNGCLSTFYDHVQKIIEGPQLDIMKDTLEQKPMPKVDAELADIKGKIENMMETLAAISEVQKKSCIPLHSTPNHSPELREGSKCNNHLSHSSSDCSISPISTNSVRRHQEGTFALFLTNVDGRVSEEEISSMVSRSLGVEQQEVMNVKKLVPRWKAHETLDFVSFKVQLNATLKSKALREDSWPTGVVYREFIERPRVIWRPTGCCTIPN